MILTKSVHGHDASIRSKYLGKMSQNTVITQIIVFFLIITITLLNCQFVISIRSNSVYLMKLFARELEERKCNKNKSLDEQISIYNEPLNTNNKLFLNKFRKHNSLIDEQF